VNENRISSGKPYGAPVDPVTMLYSLQVKKEFFMLRHMYCRTKQVAGTFMSYSINGLGRYSSINSIHFLLYFLGSSNFTLGFIIGIGIAQICKSTDLIL
jgi:hypothetical protein